MKKINKLLLCLLLCLFVKLGVCLADDIGPDYVEIPALVSNSDGAFLYKYDDNYEKLYKTKTVLSKGTEVTLTWSFEENGVTYYDIYYDDDELKSAYIKFDDVTIVSSDKFLDDEYKVNETYYVYDASEFVLREGPSEAYKEIDVKVSNGMKIKADYDIEGIYARVNVNGTYGWLYIYDDYSVANVGKYVVKVDRNNMPTAYSSPKEKSSLKTKLPIDEDIFTATYNCFSDNAYYGIEIDGTVYWFLETDVFDYYDDEYLVSINKLNIYSSISRKNGSLILENDTGKYYEYGDKLNGIYYNGSFCYINGTLSGYVKCDYLYTDEIYDDYNYRTTGNVIAYKDTSYTDVSFLIPTNEVVNVITYYGIDHMHTMIKYDGQIGWLLYEDNLEYIDSNEDENEVEPEIEDIEDETIQNDSILEEAKIEDNDLSPKEYVILGVCIAFIVGLSSFVTIKCINKSKNVNIEQVNNKSKN